MSLLNGRLGGLACLRRGDSDLPRDLSFMGEWALEGFRIFILISLANFSSSFLTSVRIILDTLRTSCFHSMG